MPRRMRMYPGRATSDSRPYALLPQNAALTYVPISGGSAFGSGPATVTLPNLNASTVQAALDAAVANDIIQLPAGTVRWSTRVLATLPADVTLRGAGWNGADGGGDATVIIDDWGSNTSMLQLAFPGRFRFSGITIQGGTAPIHDNGTVQFSSSTSSTAELRIDHCHWNMRTYTDSMKLMAIGSGVRGVADSNIFDLFGLSWIHVVNGRTNGDVEWSQPTGFGSSDFFFIEDNQFNGYTTGSVYTSAANDIHTGGKLVMRFNNLVETGVVQTHPTGHSRGDDRGARAHENYCNSCTSSLAKEPNFAFDYNNSGGAMVWGNSADQVFKNIIYLNNCRVGPGGSNCGYSQDAPPNGWGYAGTTGGGPSSWDGNTDSTGYPCIDMPGRGQGDLITGSFLTGPNRVNSTTGTIAWPNQALDPIYIWNNSGTIVSGWGGSYEANLQPSMIVAGRDYYRQSSTGGGSAQSSPTSPFNGSSGVGWGTLANRPSSGLTPGVAYFATDVGSWNTTGGNTKGVNMNGASGVLYVATGSSTWSLYYTPYTYPHPLRS